MDNVDKKRKFRSIRIELVLWFLLLSLIPLLSVAWFSYQQANKGLTEAAKSQLVQSARLNYHYIQNWFEYRVMDLNSKAKDKLSVTLLEQLIQGFEKSGLSLGNYIKSEEWKVLDNSIGSELKEFKAHYDYIYDVFLIDNDANILYTVTAESDLGTNLLHGDYAETRFAQAVKATLGTGKPAFSDLERYPPSKNIIAGFLVCPMISESGESIGVFAIQIQVERIFSLVEIHSDYATTHYLLGEDAYLRSPLKDDHSDVLVGKINTAQSKLMLREYGEKVYKGRSHAKKILNYQNQNNSDVLGIYQRLSVLGVSWFLISEVDKEKALEPAKWLGNVVFSMVAISSLLAIILSFYLARRIARPLTQLAKATLAVASGKLDQQVKGTERNEIGRLADAFNQMVIQRRQYEHNLKQSNQKVTRALADLAEQKYALDQHAIVSITNIESKITYVNEKFCESSGYSQQELIGKNHRLLKSGTHDHEFYREMYSTITAGKVWHGEICNRAKNGSLYWLDTTIVPIKGRHGLSQSYISIRSDITERKRSERALQRIQKMEAIGQLTGGIAHDFNNILGVIIGNLELLGAQLADNDKASRRIDAANKAAGRAARLTKQLLGFSRSKVTETKLTNINQLVTEMNEMFTHSLGPNVKLVYNLDKNLWLTDVSQGDLEDAILNLLINARDALPDGGKVILETSNRIFDEEFCRLNSGSIPGEYVGLNIIDDGEGIPQNQIQDIFDPFFTTKPQGKGTGLGLAMVFGFVKRSGGYIQVKSESGLGSTFKISLPRCTDKVEVASPKQTTPAEIPGGNETLLIVDDEKGLVELAQINLEKLGYRVFTAMDAEQALALLSKIPELALIFSDVVMPGKINGYELAERAIEYDPNIKILLTSGYADKAVLKNGDKPLHFDLLNKPYSQAEAAFRIREILDGFSIKRNISRASAGVKRGEPIKWSEALSIGVKEIDEDHKKLVSLYNETLDVSTKNNNSECRKILQELLSYTATHFKREEEIMAVCEYPQFKSHRQVHQLLLKQVRAMETQWQKKQLRIEKLTEFLFSWMNQHIQRMDKDIAPYCKGKEEQISRRLEQLILTGIPPVSSEINLSETAMSEPLDFSYPLEWSDTYYVGVDPIDEDHRQLMKIVNQCYEATVRGDKIALNDNLRVLLLNIEAHFGREEMILAVCESPDLKKHQQLHQLLYEQLKEIRQQQASGALSADELMHFLGHWLLEHILGTDTEVEPYCKGKDTIILRVLAQLDYDLGRRKRDDDLPA